MDSILTVRNITIFSTVIFIALFFTVLTPYVNIGENEIGLNYKMGKLSDDVLHRGIYWKLPFLQKVVRISIKPKRLNCVIPLEKYSALSKDIQPIGASISVFYKYKDSNIILTLSEFDTVILEEIILTSIISDFKSIIGEYALEDIIYNQERVLQGLLKKAGLSLLEYPIEIILIRITGYSVSQDSIEAQKQNQASLQEKEILLTKLEYEKYIKLRELFIKQMVADKWDGKNYNSISDTLSDKEIKLEK